MNNKELIGQIQYQVNNALKLYRERNKPALQRQLYELYLNFNKSGEGRLIINFPQKEKLGECFTLMLIFDWMNDNDIREVWAENGFYCFTEYLNNTKTDEEQVFGGLLLFRHLYHGGNKHLAPKVTDILKKAKQKNVFVFDDCMLASPFDNNDYDKGAVYVILQIMFLSAQMMRPLVTGNDILSVNEKEVFDTFITNSALHDFPPVAIFNKARFIKRIIGSILKDL